VDSPQKGMTSLVVRKVVNGGKLKLNTAQSLSSMWTFQLEHS